MKQKKFIEAKLFLESSKIQVKNIVIIIHGLTIELKTIQPNNTIVISNFQAF